MILPFLLRVGGSYPDLTSNALLMIIGLISSKPLRSSYLFGRDGKQDRKIPSAHRKEIFDNLNKFFIVMSKFGFMFFYMCWSPLLCS
jgi:hypothetical protein